ncbi:MAG TPA: DNA polymerase III subunit delta' [Candidatus Tectomicrobia bacterium]|nr:DNA polymerase III subunit delta' [Candidatus Tectomicrobia bacterium]
MRFDGLAIPERVRQGLRRAVKAQRLPPAYLFVGPSGVGKQTTAWTLAKALNCCVQDGDACDQCRVCRRIDRRLHPDIHLVEPQGQVIKIDQVRRLQEVLTLQAYEGRVKVAILDDAGKLTVEAGNALLKMLEEPPLRTLFVLICQHLGNLPATVISRAQVLRFGVLTHDQVVDILQKHGRESGAAERATYLSGGRPGAALTLDLPVVLERRAEALQLLTEARSGDAAGVLAHAEHWARRKGDHDTLFQMLLSLIRDLAVSRAGGGETLLMHGDLRDALAPLAAGVPAATLRDIFDIVHAAEEAIAHNANPQLAFEVMLFKIGDAYERAPQRDRQRSRHVRV